MAEPNVTASTIISFARKLEGDSRRFYERLAEKFSENKETFLLFAEESKRNEVLVTRTYRETITDALEACFSFKDLNLNEYFVEITFTEETSPSNALKMAIQLEEKASKFYLDVAEQSKSLLATIPSVLRNVAEKRSKRRLKLTSLLDSLK